ncbi:MAG: hypothetical protein U0736_25560 [Gemmataceae bacterium]
MPGLLDMARPAFTEVGTKSALRQAFWYRRTFTVAGPIPDVAVLKIHKARYGTKVFLNGKLAGEHLPCFTPALLDVKPFLKGDGQENEIVIRVGADRSCLPAGQPSGWDFEKYLFIPGIYDSVELILTGAPYIVNVQAVPDVPGKAVRVVAEVGGRPDDVALTVQVAEARGGRIVGQAKTRGRGMVDVTIPIEGCHLWSRTTRSLRVALKYRSRRRRRPLRHASFTFDPKLGQAILNGKPYLLRDTNVCVYRFFEDGSRSDKPWRAEWVRPPASAIQDDAHRTFRCAASASRPSCGTTLPTRKASLFQDEFPIWTLSEDPEKLQARRIIPEYQEWMR